MTLTYPGSGDIPMGDVVLDVPSAALSIAVESVHYHRNGVGGAGFYVVAFTRRGDSHKRRMLGIVPTDGDGYAPDGETYVIDRDDAAAMWRGDVFAGPLRDALRIHETRWSAAIDVYHAAVAS